MRKMMKLGIKRYRYVTWHIHKLTFSVSHLRSLCITVPVCRRKILCQALGSLNFIVFIIQLLCLQWPYFLDKDRQIHILNILCSSSC